MLLNKRRAYKLIGKYGLEAIIATSPVNVFYVSDFCPFSLKAEHYTILPREKDVEPALITVATDADCVADMFSPWIRDVRYHGKFYIESSSQESLSNSERRLKEDQGSWEKEKTIMDGITVLIKLLNERGLTKGKIGIDETALTPELWQRLKNGLPNVQFIWANSILEEIRMIKTNEEIKRLKRAAEITEKAWQNSLEQLKEGMNEIELAKIFDGMVISEGGKPRTKYGIYTVCIGFGSRTAFPNVQPSETRLKRGDLIRLDGGCLYEGYSCDTSRVAVFGKPREKHLSYYSAILKGEQIAIDMVRPGVRASEIFHAAVNTIKESGIPSYRRHHCGHGIGIEYYDPPLICPGDHTPLEKGMVLCIETPYYELGFGGLQIEDMLVVGKKEPRFLTKFSRELYVIDH